MLADEPTGSLDTETGAQVLDLLKSLSDELNVSLLLVTHESINSNLRSGDYDEGWLADLDWCEFLIFPNTDCLVFSKNDLQALAEKAGHYFLLIGIVAVGVGAFNGIRQASRSATANFGLFNQAISGQSDFLIESPIQRLQEKDLDTLALWLDILTGILCR